MSDLAERRALLADWLFREHRGAPYTVGQIVDVSGIYANMVVREHVGRPARWEHRL